MLAGAVLGLASAPAVQAMVRRDLPSPPLDSSDQFGYAVAVAGDTAVIGARWQDATGTGMQWPGAAYVYVRSGGQWSLQAQLLASDPAPAAEFGSAVAISQSGSTVVIGAPEGGRPGSAYVFRRTGTTWTQTKELEANVPEGGDQFGYSVAISDGQVLVGAPGTGDFDGAAYVFTLSGKHRDALIPSDLSSDSNYGDSVAMSGSELVVVGDGLFNVAGKAYVYGESGGQWVQQSELTDPTGDVHSGFGFAAALDGSTLAVTSYNHGVYVYAGGDGSWTQQAMLTNPDASGEVFGRALAVSGHTMIVGALNHRGAAYVFTNDAAGWALRKTLLASKTEGGFGAAVAMNGDEAIIGAPGARTPEGKNRGAAFVYHGSPL